VDQLRGKGVLVVLDCKGCGKQTQWFVLPGDLQPDPPTDEGD
jgi:hypothetical protein